MVRTILVFLLSLLLAHFISINVLLREFFHLVLEVFVLVCLLVIELLLHVLLESADRFVALVMLIAGRVDNHLLILQLPIVVRLNVCNLNGVLLRLIIVDAILLRVASLVTTQVNLLVFVINLVIFNELFDHLAHVILVSQLLEESRNPIELSIAHIVVPTDAWYSVLRLEQESDWRVINNYYICHVSSEAR